MDDAKNIRNLYLQTYLVEFVVFISALLCFRFAYIIFGNEGFGIYSLFRRTIGLLSPFLMLGLQIALTRFIAQTILKDEKAQIHTYFIATLILCLSAFVLFFVIIVLFSDWFGWLFFGDIRYSFLVSPLALVMLGVLIHSVAYSYFRGLMEMKKANFLQFLNLGVGNILGFAWFDDVVSVMVFTGGFWFIISVLIIITFVKPHKIKRSDLFRKMKELIVYGIQRIPANIVSIVLISLPSYIVAHNYGIEIGGYVAFGVSLLSIGASASNPISLILLPQTTMYKEQGQFAKIKSIIQRVFLFSLTISAIATVIFFVFAPQILLLYFGQINDILIHICRFVVLALPPYVIYTALRTTNDAFYDIGVNSISFLGGFILFILGIFVFSLTISNILLFFVISIYITFILMIIFIFRYLSKQNQNENNVYKCL